MNFRRVSVLSLVLTALLVLAGAPPAGAAAPASTALDPSAMMLRAPDVHAPDAWLEGGSENQLDIYSDARQEVLRADGRLRGMQVWIATTPRPKKDVEVITAVEEFRDASGANLGLGEFGPNSSVDMEVSGAPTFGQESYLFRSDEPDPTTNAPMKSLILEFQVDRIVGTLVVQDYTGHEPPVAQAETLGKTFAARIKAVLAGKTAAPGLSNRQVRLAVPSAYSFQDAYFRIGGKDVYRAGTSPEQAPTFQQIYKGATDVYESGQNVADGKWQPSLFWRIVNFPDEAAAKAWVSGYPANTMVGNSTWKQTDRSTRTAVGDQSLAIAGHDAAPSGAPTSHEYAAMMTARFGTQAVALQIWAYKPVSISVATEMMKAEAHCLQATGHCKRIPVPASLDALRLTTKSSGQNDVLLLSSAPWADLPMMGSI